MMMGHGMPPIQKFLDRGLRPSLSVDVETSAGGHVQPDAFSARAPARDGNHAREVADHNAEVLACATIDGAKANGLDAKTGSLTPGKQADVILLRTDRMNVTPLNDPATAVVAGMDTGNVDTVMIAGRVMKRHGKLLHVDWAAVKRAAADSRDHVIAKSGFRLPSI
jgi:5-methylthioadenosine/S-adenosylhomocysteine deaminase